MANCVGCVSRGTLHYCVALDEMGYLKCGSSQQNGKERIQSMPNAWYKSASETPAEKK